MQSGAEQVCNADTFKGLILVLARLDRGIFGNVEALAKRFGPLVLYTEEERLLLTSRAEYKSVSQLRALDSMIDQACWN